MAKYLIHFPVPEPFTSKVRQLMDRVSYFTGINPPYKELAPHVSFHNPVTGVSEPDMLKLVEEISLRAKKAIARVGSIDRYGRECIILPVGSSLELSRIWCGINDALRQQYRHTPSPFEDINTLHITVAKDVSSVFDESWPNVRGIPVDEMVIPVDMIELHRKVDWEDARWEKLESFHLRD